MGENEARLVSLARLWQGCQSYGGKSLARLPEREPGGRDSYRRVREGEAG